MGAGAGAACTVPADTAGAGNSAPLHGTPWYTIPVGVAHLWTSLVPPAALAAMVTQRDAEQNRAKLSAGEWSTRSSGVDATMPIGLRVERAFVVRLRLIQG